MENTNRTAVDRTRTLDRKAGRRSVLGASALASAVAAMWRPQEAQAHRRGRERGRSLVLDVACLGHTFAPNDGGALDLAGGDLRGISFCVEGLVFPAWSIPNGVEFDLESAPPSTGNWFCRGWFISHPGRPLPYTMNIQDYLLEPLTGDNLWPSDTLTTQGPEGVPETFIRSIIGGTGRYRRAQGEEVMETIGTNSSILNVTGENAPTFRFHFDLRG